MTPPLVSSYRKAHAGIVAVGILSAAVLPAHADQPLSVLGSPVVKPPLPISVLSPQLRSMIAQQPADTSLFIPPDQLKTGPQPTGQFPTIDDILKSTVTSPSTEPAYQLPLSDINVPRLPPEVNDHSKNKTIDLGPLHTGPLIQIATLRPLRLEASFNAPVTLRDCLVYALRNNLPIRINQQTAELQKYAYYGALSGFLPSVATNLFWTHSHIFPETEVNSRVFQESINFPIFQGGAVMYSSRSQFYLLQAARHQYATSVNDTLLNVYNSYYNLLLQRALLQIRIKSVEVSQAQLKLNEQLYFAGTGTRFAVMQSRTQLALDRQALLQQQVAVRLATIQLAYNLNLPLSINLVPAESSVTEASLVDESMGINDLLNVTLSHRPELRQYEFLRLSAARSIQVAASAFYPTVQWTISYQHTSTSINPKKDSGVFSSSAGGLATAAANSTASSGGGGLGSGPAVAVTTAGIPIISGTPLPMNQILPGTGNLTITPGSSNTTFGTATGATTTGGGGSTVVTGGSGLLGPAAGVGSGSASAFSGGGVQSVGAFGGKINSVSFSFNVNWTMGGLGSRYAAQVLQARVVARQALLQANQVLQQVSQQVRSSYLNALTAREQIDVTARGVASSAEALRLANLRVQMGVGTNLELIQAQRDYITALINQAQAIIASDQAQAQVLHDTGLISVETLTRGYKRRLGSTGNRNTY